VGRFGHRAQGARDPQCSAFAQCDQTRGKGSVAAQENHQHLTDGILLLVHGKSPQVTKFYLAESEQRARPRACLFKMDFMERGFKLKKD